MTEKRFVSEDDCCGYYTEIIDNEKKLDLSLHNPKKNLTIEELVDLLNKLSEENKRLADFSFRYTENYNEFDKDELEVEDTHTKINLKNGKLAIMVFVPETNDWFTFNYIVSGRRIMHEFMGLEE